MQNKFLLTTIFLLIFLAVLPASAQFDFGASADNFFIELRPTDAPGPGQTVYARLSGFSFDIDRSQISWTHNGALRARGTGLREYSFTSGSAGALERLNVSAVDANGVRHEAELSFVVSDFDILWRAGSSAPFWYKGKALASVKSAITVSAFPNLISGGRKIPSSSLIFRWSLDDDFKQDKSGAGKNTFRFTAGLSPGLTHAVNLEVSNVSSDITAKKTININIENPSVLIYEEDALLGTKTGAAFNDRTGAAMFAGSKKTFTAYPFFFSLDQSRENFEYLWSVNGQTAEAIEPRNTLLVEASPDAGGRSSIGVLIKNLSNILQEVSQNFSINVI